MTRTIIPKNSEYAETPCFQCGSDNTLKIKRLVAMSRQGSKQRLSVRFGCKCEHCGFSQDVQLVEMP